MLDCIIKNSVLALVVCGPQDTQVELRGKPVSVIGTKREAHECKVNKKKKNEKQKSVVLSRIGASQIYAFNGA